MPTRIEGGAAMIVMGAINAGIAVLVSGTGWELWLPALLTAVAVVTVGWALLFSLYTPD